MKFTGLTPSLIVDDIRDTVAYYHNNFGFEVLSTMPAGEAYQWALMERNDVVLMFQAKSGLKGKMAQATTPGSGIALCVNLDGVEELFDSIVESVEIVCDLDESPSGGQEFTILDPNGYLVTFAGS